MSRLCSLYRINFFPTVSEGLAGILTETLKFGGICLFKEDVSFLLKDLNADTPEKNCSLP